MSERHANQARHIVASHLMTAMAQSNQYNRFNPLRQALAAAEAKLVPLGEESELRRAGRALLYAGMQRVEEHSKGAVPDELYAHLRPLAE